MKKVLSLILMALLPMVASAEYVNGINYSFNSSAKTATVKSGSYSGNVNIPSTVYYNGTTYSVTEIGQYAFSQRSGMTSVTIPISVTQIASEAFYNCSGLTSVTIPSSVTYIGAGAFWNCSGLSSVTILCSDVTMYEDTFSGCSNLQAVHINDLRDWCKIKFWASPSSNPLCYAHHLFLNGTEISDLVIPDGVTSIGNKAFYNCSSITSVTIPSSVTSIDNNAFYGCSGLTSIVSKIKKPFVIDNSVFDSNIYATATLTVPYGTKSLYESTAGWNQFQNVVEANPIGETVIYEKDFTGITEFTGWSQFADEQTDGKVGVDPNGVAITVGVQTGQIWQPQVMVIPDGSFNLESGGNYRVIITAKFPTDGTLQINMGSWSANEQNQFYVKSTGDFQTIVCDFDDWPVTAEGAHLLFQCGYFKGTTIVKKIQIIDMGDTVIPFCLDNIYYNLYTKDKIAIVTANPQKYQGEVNIPSTLLFKGEKYTVVSVGKIAFNGCSRLTSVSIPPSVNSIGFCAFQSCSSLTSVAIPNSVTYIGSYAFGYCSGLTSVTVGNSLTSIGYNAFSGCNNMQYVCLSSDKFPSSQSLGNTSCQYIMPQTAFEGGIPQDIKNYATYGVTPKYIRVKSTTATTATLELTPIDITSGKSNGTTTYEAKVYDLKPGAAVSGSWELEDKDCGLVSIPTVYTKSIVMNAQSAQAMSMTKAKLLATVDEPDDDKHYGFEWVRYDAPDGMSPYQVQAQLYQGKIVGALGNLNSEKYYKYRPYYKADDGTIFRGDWSIFTTGDYNVFFDPDVHTKEPVVLSDGGIVLLLFFAEGTEEILEKGFELIKKALEKIGTRSTDDDVTRVIVNDNGTSATVKDLEPGTEYVYRSYVKTASGTTYGEEVTFKTPLPGDANDDGKVNAADIVEVVNAKAGNPSASFNMTNADMDGNGSLTEADITAIVNIIMR